MMTLNQWLDETEKLQKSSHRKCMSSETPTGQLGIALRIIRRLRSCVENHADADMAIRSAEGIINTETKT
jgi:hypothetical protein